MTTKEMQAQEAVVKELFVGNVEVAKIEVVENARKNFDATEMKELTESVRHYGIVVPVLLAKNGKEGHYRLIAGERRLRAAKAVGLKDIPARVMEADETKLDELQVLENLHRADLGPIEEARAFKKLMDTGKHTVEGLAKQVDKSVAYLVRSIRLLELPKEAIKAIEKRAITPEHGHQILRVPEDKREKLVAWALTEKWGGVLPAIHELKNEIERRIERDLSEACFPKDKDYAGIAPCSGCEFNTSNQNVLFSGSVSGKCTNGNCFSRKTNHFLREFKEKAEKQFAGLKFVGMTASIYGGGVKGGIILRPEETKSEKVKALVEKNPEKFGVAVIKPSRFGSPKPSVALVCVDEKLLNEKIREPIKNGGPRPMTPEEQERERFLQSAEIYALFAEASRKVQAIRKHHLVDIVLALNGLEAAYEAIGVPESQDVQAELSKMKEKDLLRLAWLCTFEHWNLDEKFGAVGVATQKVRKEARARALAEWEKHQKDQAEAAN